MKKRPKAQNSSLAPSLAPPRSSLEGVMILPHPSSATNERMMSCSPSHIGDAAHQHTTGNQTIAMPDRILYHTWSIRTISPFTIPLFSSGATLNAVEEQLTSFVRRKTSNEEGTYATIAWIAFSPSQRPLHIEIRLQDQPVAYLLLCFPEFNETSVTSFSYAMQRGSRTLCDTVMQWFESTFGCVFGNQSFSPAPNQVAHALAVWTTLQLDRSNYNRPLEVTFTAPDNIAKAGLSKLSLTVPPVAVARLLQDIQDNDTNAGEQQEIPILRALQCYVLETYHLRIESFALVRATSAAAMLGCDGRCKPLESDLLEHVLSEIQAMIRSQLRMQPNEPLDMGMEDAKVD